MHSAGNFGERENCRPGSGEPAGKRTTRSAAEEHRVHLSGIQPVSDADGGRERGVGAGLERHSRGEGEGRIAATARAGGAGGEARRVSVGPEWRTETARGGGAGAVRIARRNSSGRADGGAGFALG